MDCIMGKERKLIKGKVMSYITFFFFLFVISCWFEIFFFKKINILKISIEEEGGGASGMPCTIAHGIGFET